MEFGIVAPSRLTLGAVVALSTALCVIEMGLMLTQVAKGLRLRLGKTARWRVSSGAIASPAERWT